MLGGHGDADGGRRLHLLAEDDERACSWPRAMRWASWSMASWSASPGSRMANSSPPTRATVSWLRTVSTSRWLTCWMRSSPAAWPRVSLTVLKWSRSTKNMHTGSPTRRDRTSSCSTRSSKSRRLGSPVRASCQAMCETFSSSSRFCRAVAAWSASPDSRSWRSGSWMAASGVAGAEVGRDHPEELPGGEQRGHHRGRRARPVQQVAQIGVLGRGVEDHHLAVVHHPLDERWCRCGRSATVAGAGLGDAGPDPWAAGPSAGPSAGSDRAGRMGTIGPVVGVGGLQAGRSGPGGPAARSRRPTGRPSTGRSRSPPGRCRPAAGPARPGWSTRESGLGEGEQGPGGGVAALGVGEHAEDVEGGGGVLGVEVEQPGLRRRVRRRRGQELDQPAVAAPGRGDVDDEPGAVGVVGVLAPQLGGQPLGLVGLEAPVSGAGSACPAGPGPSAGSGGPTTTASARAGDLGQQRLDVVVEELERVAKAPSTSTLIRSQLAPGSSAGRPVTGADRVAVGPSRVGPAVPRPPLRRHRPVPPPLRSASAGPAAEPRSASGPDRAVRPHRSRWPPS